MKKARLVFSIVLVTIFIEMIFNLDTSTKQCINYECHTYKIPLYLKILDFFGRHYHYKLLVKDIINSQDSDEVRAMKIFVWVYNNLKRIPDGFPVTDDHVWHTIIRGYGIDDQFQDAFTTLCNYASLDAFFDYVYGKNKEDKKSLSFVRMNKTWTVLDAYNGVYFKNGQGRMASIEDIISGDWRVANLKMGSIAGTYYTQYFKNLASVNWKQYKLSRPTLQSPLNRLIFLLKKKK